MSEAVNQGKVERRLEEGYDSDNAETHKGHDREVHNSDGGWIRKQYHSLCFTVVVGFIVCFFADFGARGAYDMYLNNQNTAPSQAKNHRYELLFYSNMVQGSMYAVASFCIITPGLDKLFHSLFWDPRYFPAAKAPAHFLSRNMGLVVFGLSIAQLLQPSNPGTGIVALCANAMVTLNFIMAVVFDYYAGVRNRNIMWTQFLIGCIVFTALFAVALERVNFFHNMWKNDSQHEQTMLFYLNMISALSYMPLGLLNLSPGGDTWFMSFFFKGTVYKQQTADAFFSHNLALVMVGLCGAQMIAPTSTGVGVVSFFVYLFQAPNMFAAFAGYYANTINKMLWAGFVLSSVLFAVLYAVALNRLNNCDPTDATCGMYSGWKDAPWNRYDHPEFSP